VPDVVMPRLSDSMEEGTILKWLKATGDEVRRGEELVEIETDKANMTYEADQDGVLELLAQEGDTLPVGGVIARIGGGEPVAATAGAAAPAAVATAPAEAATPSAAAAQPAESTASPPVSPTQPAPAEPPAPVGPTPPAAPAPPPVRPAPQVGAADGNGRVKASPVARRMARELGLDITGLAGSGPGGRIVKADIEAAASGAPAQAPAAPAAVPSAAPPQPAAAPPPPAPVSGLGAGDVGTAKGEVRVEDLTKTQQVIARRMAESKATVPEFTLEMEIDMERAVELRAQLKAVAGEDGVVPSYNDMVVKACALALREFPRANGAYRDGRFELYSRVNVGVAVAAQDALVVPTVFDADQKSLGEIAREARALAERVRAGVVTPPELSGGTFTVSNLGMFGISNFTAVINPPQAAILAVGALEPRAVVRDGELVARHTMGVTLACDHRILYGAPAAEFLRRIRELLEQPLALAL